MNKYKMMDGSSINAAMDALPVGEQVEIKSIKYGEDIKNFKAIRVTEHTGKVSHVAVPTDKYQLVQHKDAFKPIVEGITMAGAKDFKYICYSTPSRAYLQIYSGASGYDTVQLGFKISNSLDSDSSLRYGFDLAKQQKYIELVGYRQVCSNGMKVRVPLEEAEFIRPELVQEIQSLLSESTAIRHTESAVDKIKAMQYVAEALELLREPVERMIKASQNIKIVDADRLKELIKLHVGKRFAKRVSTAMANEENDLWGLYNAMTYVASHDDELSTGSSETLKEKAADMMLVELKSSIRAQGVTQ